MPWTRDVLIDRVRHVANAEDATGDWPVDVVLDEASLVHQQEWGHLLDMNPHLRLSLQLVSMDNSGTLPFATLSDGTNRLDRIVLLCHGNVGLMEMLQRWEAGRRSTPWARLGDTLVTDLPNAEMTVLFTHLPLLVRDLPLPASTPGGDVLSPVVEFPEGWELLLAYETAAHLLHKGARESDAAGVLEQKAESIRQRMLSRLGRERTEPLQVRAVDDAVEWGG